MLLFIVWGLLCGVWCVQSVVVWLAVAVCCCVVAFGVVCWCASSLTVACYFLLLFGVDRRCVLFVGCWFLVSVVVCLFGDVCCCFFG